VATRVEIAPDGARRVRTARRRDRIARWLRRRDDGDAIDRGEPAAIDGEDVAEAGAVDPVALIVALRLEHEQRGVGAEDPMRHRERDDALGEGLGATVAPLL